MSTSIKNQIKNTIAILKDHICRRIDVVDNVSSTSIDLPLSANMGKTLNDKINVINANLTGKIIIEIITAKIDANTDYSYVQHKSEYALVASHGTTFNGIYVTGIADVGSNCYAVFYNKKSEQTASITLSLTWIKI